ncbi:MAG: sodium/proton-translocating pyrophosphatase [Fimbriimonas sp.]|nr:sodium/proton-translocating pyrophosphatase [Fimbriimonas sp.]
MKLLQHASMQARGFASLRATKLLVLALVGTLIPTAAFAAEGDNVKLAFSSGDRNLLWLSFILGLVALGFALYLRKNVMAQSPGSEKMQEVGRAIKEGALAYLSQQVRMMLYFVVVLALGLAALNWSKGSPTAIAIALCFIGGVAASYIAGYTGMLTAVEGNMRTANAALTTYKRALEVAFRSGAVAGMVTVAMGLIGASLILLFGGDKAMTLLIGFGFGGSLAALFMRVGGGIFTKAADVGADLVGKVEAGIPEDDPRNPATIADNVGDNVGDCAGMAADIFESYEVTLVAAIVLGAATASVFDQSTWMRLILFALMARGVGVLASIFGILSVKGTDDVDSDPLACIRWGFYKSAAVAAALTFVLAYVFMGGMGTDSKVKATTLVPQVNVLRKDVLALASIRDEIAAKKGIQYYEVKPEDLVADTRVQELGFKDKNEQLLPRLIQSKTPETDLPETPAPKGYSAITNFNDSNPILSYAVSPGFPSDSQNPNLPPPRYTVGSLFGAAGKDRIIMAKFHIVTDIPGQPAQPATPTSPARPASPSTHEDITAWQGPNKESNLDLEVTNFKTRAPAGSKIEILDKAPVTLFANRDGDLIIGLPSVIDRVDQIAQQGFGFQKLTNKQIDDMLAKKATMPPPSTMQMAIATMQTVPWWAFGSAIFFGILMAFAIEFLTDYYVSTHKKPTQEVAGVSSAGPAPMIIQGFAYALESSVFMVFAIVVALMFPLFLFSPTLYGGYILSFYGIALVGLGLLTTTGYILAMDTFGPISDNAQGVYEMSGEGHDNEYGMKAVQRLDAAGNTTKALTKGFAIATAVVAAVALFHSYLESAKLDAIGLRLDVPEIFLGMLIGAAAPYLFSSSTINAVGRASFQLINEVRRQFKADPGIMLGTSKPDYARCVAIVTAAAQKELLGPGILAIGLPMAVAFGFSIGKPPTMIGGHMYNLTGAEALGGFLAGAIVSGQLMAVLLANSGGMWDNAKKLIEDGLYGGKGTDAHKAGVVCDTVGDPFKDTAGPALNPLIKVMNLVALLLAEVVIEPLSNTTLVIITAVAVAALATSIIISKQSSMSTEMARATSGGPEVVVPPALAEPAAEIPAKKRITVEDTTEAPSTEEPKEK